MYTQCVSHMYTYIQVHSHQYRYTGADTGTDTLVEVFPLILNDAGSGVTSIQVQIHEHWYSGTCTLVYCTPVHVHWCTLQVHCGRYRNRYSGGGVSTDDAGSGVTSIQAFFPGDGTGDPFC